MSYSREKPYNDLPLLPPDNSVFESISIYKKLSQARAALAELKGRLSIIPNPNMLINTLVLQEAKDSSEIENIITTHDKLYKAISLKRPHIQPHTQEVLDYRKALFMGFEMIQTKGFLSINMIKQIQQEFEHNKVGLRKLPGTKLANDKTGEVMYTPPDNHTDILRLMKNLEDFLNNDDNEIDPLIKLAMLHYQFEAIHPFYDGNGRTGRIINVLYLVLKDLLREPFLYLSSYIIKNKSEYYKLLRSVTADDNWEEWIMFMLVAIEKTSLKTLATSQNIITIFDDFTEKVKTEKPAIYSKELIEILFSKVYTKIADLVENSIASRNIASKYLRELEKIGILQSEKIGRETIYINRALFEVLINS